MKTKFPDKLELYINQDSISLGEKCSCSKCPIALAARGLFPNCLISVDGDLLAIREPEKLSWETYGLPMEAGSFIDNFDNGLKVVPFSFTATKEKTE